MKVKRHRNKALSAAAILLCLVLVTTVLVSGVFARFSVGDSGTDSARVAAFAVSGTGFTQTVNLGVKMNPGDEADRAKHFSFLVTNDSEVSVDYIVNIRNTTGNLPLVLNVQDASAADLAKFNTADGYTYRATLGANSGARNFEFALSWPAADNDLVYSGQLDNIAVTVTAAQAD